MKFNWTILNLIRVPDHRCNLQLHKLIHKIVDLLHPYSIPSIVSGKESIAWAMKVFTAHQRKSSYSTTNILHTRQPRTPPRRRATRRTARRTASKSRGMEGRRHEKNACRLYSALAMTLKVIFSLSMEKMLVNRKIYFNLKLVRLWKIQRSRGRKTKTREKHVPALLNFSHDMWFLATSWKNVGQWEYCLNL